MNFGFCDFVDLDASSLTLQLPKPEMSKYRGPGLHKSEEREQKENGRTHMLLPMEEKRAKEEASTSILLMSGKELLKEAKEE